jgi:cytochrome c556
MKSNSRKLKQAFDLLHEYTGGTFTLYKTGSMEHGEQWEALFRVGYGRHEFRAEASDPATAIARAAAKIPNAPAKVCAAISGDPFSTENPNNARHLDA